MLAGRYTLFEQQESRTVMAEAQARGVSILAAGPYNSGLLSGTEGPGAFYNYRPAEQETLRKAQRFYDLCAEVAVEVGAAALQFPLAHPAVATVVCGLRSPAEVDSAVIRMGSRIPAELWPALRSAGLLDDGRTDAMTMVDAHQHYWQPGPRRLRLAGAGTLVAATRLPARGTADAAARRRRPVQRAGAGGAERSGNALPVRPGQGRYRRRRRRRLGRHGGRRCPRAYRST